MKYHPDVPKGARTVVAPHCYIALHIVNIKISIGSIYMQIAVDVLDIRIIESVTDSRGPTYTLNPHSPHCVANIYPRHWGWSQICPPEPADLSRPFLWRNNTYP